MKLITAPINDKFCFTSLRISENRKKVTLNLEQLAIRAKSQIRFIDYEAIVFSEADSNYITVCL